MFFSAHPFFIILVVVDAVVIVPHNKLFLLPRSQSVGFYLRMHYADALFPERNRKLSERENCTFIFFLALYELCSQCTCEETLHISNDVMMVLLLPPARGSRTSLLINLGNFKQRHRHAKTTATSYFVFVHWLLCYIAFCQQSFIIYRHHRATAAATATTNYQKGESMIQRLCVHKPFRMGAG